jgi:hypothetical protein
MFQKRFRKGDNNMKNTYETPKLIVHGTVEDLTQFFGSQTATDTLYVAGQPYGSGYPGSQDGQIIPLLP